MEIATEEDDPSFRRARRLDGRCEPLRHHDRENWSALFDELGVDLVLAGHDHVYVRTAPTYAGERSADPARGTVYLGSTAVGDRHREADPENPYTNIERIIGGERTLGTVVSVRGGALRLRPYDLDGVVVDEAVVR